ncbi:GNAT family N-acetyltransferase [Rhodoferax sp.]|jgi:RimJ/RimL family protein N-acetyltransferase|uniref:GNAT family N-acetyltransferase n=2 Tax=Rhodoferax sp. TaxID=50421 RepID=UPI00351D1101
MTDILSDPLVSADVAAAATRATLRARVARKPDVMVPIRSLGENHRARIAIHLKTLDAHDRYFRFGFVANDEQIDRYVNGLNFERDEIFGIYNRNLVLIAVAHLAYAPETGARPSAEFGVSVLAQARGRHYGSRLFERAMMHARNVGVSRLYVHVLSENTAMLRIARHAGATFVIDGSETEGHLTLPPATFNSQVTEMVEEHMAQANYRIKVQAKQFRHTLSSLQSAWLGTTGAEKRD